MPNSVSVSGSARPSQLASWRSGSMDRRPCASRGAGLAAPQDRAHARHELARRERLGEVIVAADLEAVDAVDLVVLGRQEHDRHRAAARIRAQAAAHLDAVELGHEDVEHHQRRAVGGEARERLHAVGGHRGGEAGPLQRKAHHVADSRIVVHHEHLEHAGIVGATHGRDSGLHQGCTEILVSCTRPPSPLHGAPRHWPQVRTEPLRAPDPPHVLRHRAQAEPAAPARVRRPGGRSARRGSAACAAGGAGGRPRAPAL
jgi:hypothetical protein